MFEADFYSCKVVAVSLQILGCCLANPLTIGIQDDVKATDKLSEPHKASGAETGQVY